MNGLPAVYVSGSPVHPGSIWTQFGSRITDGYETDYSVEIPLDLASVVIGYRREGKGAWADLIWDDIEVVGGSMLEMYLSNIAKVTLAGHSTFDWVAVNVNDVTETAEVLTITGRIRRMLPHLGAPTLVPLA